jgi:hypothetical protein
MLVVAQVNMPVMAESVTRPAANRFVRFHHDRGRWRFDCCQGLAPSVDAGLREGGSRGEDENPSVLDAIGGPLEYAGNGAGFGGKDDGGSTNDSSTNGGQLRKVPHKDSTELQVGRKFLPVGEVFVTCNNGITGKVCEERTVLDIFEANLAIAFSLKAGGRRCETRRDLLR